MRSEAALTGIPFSISIDVQPPKPSTPPRSFLQPPGLVNRSPTSAKVHPAPDEGSGKHRKSSTGRSPSRTPPRTPIQGRSPGSHGNNLTPQSHDGGFGMKYPGRHGEGKHDKSHKNRHGHSSPKPRKPKSRMSPDDRRAWAREQVAGLVKEYLIMS